MLQYLTDDLLSGYGLPKKRMTIYNYGDYSLLTLRESVITYDTCDDTPPSRLVFQDDDTIAIGSYGHRTSWSLHTDATVKWVGFSSGRVSLKWDNLHIFLD